MKSFTYLLLSIFLMLQFSSCKVSKKKKQKYITGFYQELKDSFPNAEVSLLKDSIKVIFPDNVMFDVGSVVWKDAFFEKLIRFSKLLNKYDKTNLLITGHTDNTGEGDINEKLSKSRAENVKLKMIEYNVAKERLFVWGLGSRRPRESNDTEEGRQLNRRTEFEILGN